MKGLAISLAKRLGYDITPTWRIADAPMVRRLQAIFAKRHIDRVIDVGANNGQFYRFLRTHVGFAGEIISFEPIPELAAKLREQSAADPSWTVHDCALGSASGELTLNVAAMSVFSSFLKPLPVDPTDGGNVTARTVRVPVRTIDELFPDTATLQQTFLKLDTQGFDLEVAKGAERALKSIPALQTEISFRALYDGMPDYATSLSTFGRYGFQVADMFLVTADLDDSAYEFDCLMVRPAG